MWCKSLTHIALRYLELPIRLTFTSLQSLFRSDCSKLELLEADGEYGATEGKPIIFTQLSLEGLGRLTQLTCLTVEHPLNANCYTPVLRLPLLEHLQICFGREQTSMNRQRVASEALKSLQLEGGLCSLVRDGSTPSKTWREVIVAQIGWTTHINQNPQSY